MRELQTLNPSADTASNAQILFLVLNASSLTLLPVSIFMYRAQQGAHDPTLVFLPILLATSASTLTGLSRGRVRAEAASCAIRSCWLWLLAFARAARRLHRAAGDAAGGRARAAVVAARQPHAVRDRDRVPDRGCVAQGAGLRKFRRRREAGLRGREGSAAVSRRDAVRGRRAARIGRARFRARRHPLARGREPASTRASSTRCRPRWSSRSRAAPRARC